jgi:cob(I)alamin adenosyltransferase
MAFKIYTKTGDGGNTSLIGGTKVAKNNIRIDAYGTIDELNSYIGLIGDQVNDTRTKSTLKEIQDRLFTIGSTLATDPEKQTAIHLPDLLEDDVALLEKEIDSMHEVLPVMKHFILPGGHVAVSTIHIARCVCRRAERLCVGMKEQNLFVDPLVIKYVNRLSDYLFVAARYTGHLLNVSEVAWYPRIHNKS